jgi:ankyrin repeat protein
MAGGADGGREREAFRRIHGRDARGQTGVMLAALPGSARGAGLDRPAKHRLGALMLAATGNPPPVARTLVVEDADLTIRGSDARGLHGESAPDPAEAAAHTEVAALLRDAGARS